MAPPPALRRVTDKTPAAVDRCAEVQRAPPVALERHPPARVVSHQRLYHADASDVEVQLVSHARLDAPDFSALLPQCGVLTPPLVQRQVYLRPVGAAGELQSQEALVYACSWWNERDFEASMGARPGVPIWRNLSAQRAECFREHAGLVLGDPPPGGDAGLSAAFGMEGPFWGRWYTLWRGGAALTVIYEVFSPKLGVWCGNNDGRD